MDKNLKFSEINNKNVFTPQQYAEVAYTNNGGLCSDGSTALPCSDINLKTGDLTETNSKITIKSDNYGQTFTCNGDCCKIPPTSDKITQLVWNSTEEMWNCTVSPDTPTTFGCLDVNGGTCTRINNGPYKDYKTCSEKCPKVKLGFVETKNMGCHGSQPQCPAGYESHPYKTSGGMGSQDYCNMCTKTHMCEINAEDLIATKSTHNENNCFKIKETLKNKCPNIPISESKGCGWGNVWGNCNLGYVQNPSGYSTTLYGRPDCGWFWPCKWDGEDVFCNHNGDACKRGWNNQITTLKLAGEEYDFDSTPGAFKTQGVCAIQLEKNNKNDLF